MESTNEAPKFYTLSEEELHEIAKESARAGAKEGVAAYKKEEEKRRQAYAEKVRYSAKLIVIHYRRLKKMKDTTVDNIEEVTDPTLKEIFDRMLDNIRDGEFELTSTNRNRLMTGMMLNHVDVQLDNYRRECARSKYPEVQRRYGIVRKMYLQEEQLTAEDVANEYLIDKSNVYRTLEKAYDDLAVLFFGLEGLKVSDIRSGRKKKSDSNAKKSH